MNFSKTIAIVIFLLNVGLTELASAQQATWISHPGDYEIWLSNKMQNRRTERRAFYPPFWRLYSPYNLVDLDKKCDLTTGNEMEIVAEGQYNVTIDGKLLAGRPEKVALPAGKQDDYVNVFNQATVPAIHVQDDPLMLPTIASPHYHAAGFVPRAFLVFALLIPALPGAPPTMRPRRRRRSQRRASP